MEASFFFKTNEWTLIASFMAILWLASKVLALMVTLVILVIIDLERPKRGLIQVENTRLYELKETVESFPDLP
jgi:hypothetical protein